MVKPKFRLNSRSALVAMVSAAFAGPALGTTAGRVDFVFGEASLRGANGQVRAVAKGTEVLDGDTLVTGNGRAQIRFTDGAFVSLQPNTEFGVREYRYEGRTDGTERGLFALVRGAMRTVTGAIGRYNRSSYQVRTPTATVGIRGTGGLIEVLPDLSTLIKGTSGIWVLTNPAGQIDVPAGTSAIATPDLKEPPKQTSQQPEAPPRPLPVETTYSEGERTTDTGEACSVLRTCDLRTVPPIPPNPNPSLVSGSGYHTSFAWGTGTTPFANSLGVLGNATFSPVGELTSFVPSGPTTFSGTHQEFGTAGGVLAWGRWTGAVLDGINGALNFTANQGYHYVVGLPSLVGTLPGSGTVAYTLLGATKPTGSDGTVAPGTFSGNLSVDFGLSSVTAVINTSFGTWGHNLTLTSTNFATSKPAFSGSNSFVFSATAGAPNQYGCGACGCSASFNGALFGAGGTFAGIAYVINTAGGAAPANITGTAAFKQ
jgi:hypothetical protein